MIKKIAIIFICLNAFIMPNAIHASDIVQPISLLQAEQTLQVLSQEWWSTSDVNLQQQYHAEAQTIRAIFPNASPIGGYSQEVSRGGNIELQAKVTSYCLGGAAEDATTSTGTWVKPGTAAVDPRNIPYGTRLFIPGYGPAIAVDTGSALMADGNIGIIHIDVWMANCHDSMIWGVKYESVILEAA